MIKKVIGSITEKIEKKVGFIKKGINCLKGKRRAKGRKKLSEEIDRQTPSVKSTKSEEQWKRYLNSVLKGRGIDTSLPDDINDALSLAGELLRRSGAKLVQKSIKERIHQVSLAQEAGSEQLRVDRLNKLRDDIDDLKRHWTAEIERFKSLESVKDNSNEEYKTVQKILIKDLKSVIPKRLNSLNLREDWLVWADFSDLEIAIGALEELEKIAKKYGI